MDSLYSPMRGISRVNSGKGNYWFVRINWKDKKPGLQKIFMDSTRGGIVGSFRDAVQWRDDNIDISTIKHRLDRPIPKRNLETTAPTEQKEAWKKERISMRLTSIEKYGRVKIIVGTGYQAALRARKMGASQVTFWKISSGKQDFYQVNNCMPGYHLSWKDRKNGKKSDIEVQKTIGKKKIVFGIGRDAALKAQESGANQQTCTNIFNGKQDFFKCCHTIPYFEVGGFKRTIPDEVIKEIRIITHRYAYQDADDIAAEVMINYASRPEIPDREGFVRSLTFKYIKINRVRKDYKKGSVPLDLNGNIEVSMQGGGTLGLGITPDPYYEAMRC